MKQFIALFLALLMTVSLCACGSTPSDPVSTPDAGTTGVTGVTGTTTTSTASTSNPAESGYVVTVVDSENNPVPNATLQMCKLGDDGSCTPGNPSDTEGKVTFSLPEDSYKVSFIVMPTGYTYAGEEQEFYFADGAKELTITLAKAE